MSTNDAQLHLEACVSLLERCEPHVPDSKRASDEEWISVLRAAKAYLIGQASPPRITITIEDLGPEGVIIISTPTLEDLAGKVGRRGHRLTKAESLALVAWVAIRDESLRGGR